MSTQLPDMILPEGITLTLKQVVEVGEEEISGQEMLNQVSSNLEQHAGTDIEQMFEQHLDLVPEEWELWNLVFGKIALEDSEGNVTFYIHAGGCWNFDQYPAEDDKFSDHDQFVLFRRS